MPHIRSAGSPGRKLNYIPFPERIAGVVDEIGRCFGVVFPNLPVPFAVLIGYPHGFGHEAYAGYGAAFEGVGVLPDGGGRQVRWPGDLLFLVLAFLLL